MHDTEDSKEYRWECPYRDCKFFLLQYVQEGFEEKKRDHLDKHLAAMKAERAEREAKLQAREKQQKLLKESNADVIKDYNKLRLTITDAGFLMTRGIKLDEDCIVNAP